MNHESGYKSAVMLKALLERFEKGGEEKTLLSFLPTYTLATVEKASAPQKLDFAKLLSSFTWIEGIHPSWFLPQLKSLPGQTAALCLHLFSDENQKVLQENLKIPINHKKPSPLISLFLAEFLKTKIEKEEVLAIEHLPASPFNKLLELSRAQLLHLVDLLGMFDLAADLKQIIDKKLIERIHGALTKDQLSFLNYASGQALKWTGSKLGLENWTGDKQILLSLLHKRGLIRLGKSVMGENKSFVWHLCHKFDTGRGEFLMKLFAVKEDPAMISYLKGQTLHLLTRFKI